jgi:hypothetical protein
MAGEDFVQVALTAAGVEKAGAGKYIRVRFAATDLRFEVGMPLRLTRFEWASVAPMKYNGQPIFEVVPSGAPAAVVAPATAAPAKPAAPDTATNRPGKIWPPAAGAPDSGFASTAAAAEEKK